MDRSSTIIPLSIGFATGAAVCAVAWHLNSNQSSSNQTTCKKSKPVSVKQQEASAPSAEHSFRASREHYRLPSPRRKLRTGRWEFLLVNGPNLNLLGKREPEIYGKATLADVVQRIVSFATQFNANVTDFQSNCEGKIIQRIHEALGKVDFIIINPGGLTHTSVALRDALLGVGIPFHEVHLSNIHARESFRHHSYISDKAQGVIRGFGVDGYELAVMSAFKTLEGTHSARRTFFAILSTPFKCCNCCTGHTHITFPDLKSGQLTPHYSKNTDSSEYKPCRLLVLDGPNFRLKNFGMFDGVSLQDVRKSVEAVVEVRSLPCVHCCVHNHTPA
jgi:3-dehydroquinate dehydratase-2